jgi:type I restriction enzyme M protein
MTTSSIVQKVWNYCNILRDDGVSYGDYLEQLTYLSFLRWLMSIQDLRITEQQ